VVKIGLQAIYPWLKVTRDVLEIDSSSADDGDYELRHKCKQNTTWAHQLQLFQA